LFIIPFIGILISLVEISGNTFPWLLAGGFCVYGILLLQLEDAVE
jgi:hypothetical protein